MKRWAIITVGLYLVAVLSLSGPVWLAAFGWGPGSWRMDLPKILSAFNHWGYWVWIGVSVIGQVLLLVVPVASAAQRPQQRRRLLVPVVTAAFLMAFICVSAIVALAAGIWGDNCGKVLAPFGNNEGRTIWWTFTVYIAVAWTAWGMVFRRFLADNDPAVLTTRLLRWLLRGSILELLVAVPSHVIARQRNDCCAPIGTFWGIVTGLTVMLLSFGPGVFYLYVARLRRLRPSEPSPTTSNTDQV